MDTTSITAIRYSTIYDSRGVETIEVEVETPCGSGRAAAPFGAPGSRGAFEAPAYAPGGIDESIQLLKGAIVPELLGMDASRQEDIDAALVQIDGTPNFERLGGNTAAAVSTAVAKAAASSLGLPLFRLLCEGVEPSLPFPLGNVIGGGAHSLGPSPDMQEHLVVPVGARTFRHAVVVNIKVHERVGRMLEERDPAFTGGADDENAWAANLNDVEALELLERAASSVADEEGIEIRLGLDLAADRLWDPEGGQYRYAREGAARTPAQQLRFLCELVDRFRLVFVEDAFHSSDFESFAQLNEQVGDRCLICADDIFASNVERTAKGILESAATAVIIKPNQVGTITGARRTSSLAQANGIQVVLSHRSGETEDDSIAHLAVAWNALMIKTGVKGGERLAKLNELIRIEKSRPDIRLPEWGR